MNNPSSYNIITQNSSVLQILQRMNTIAASEGSVLLIGETGVGKELFAEYIHRTSHRNHNPLIKVSLSSLPENLIESELFGHVKGAFTGSNHDKKGQFELANNGTIFLDDIDDFPMDLQPKLLRVLESGIITPIGGQSPVPLDIRLITASKMDLSEMVAQKRFRMDLFYRINVFPIAIPPLRERLDDIEILVEHFLQYYEPEKNIVVSENVLDALMNYNWPGNIRELRNVIQRIALFSNGKITLENLPNEIKGEKPLHSFLKACGHCFKNNKMTYEEIMCCVESHLLENALMYSEGNQSKAARSLGLSLSTFRDKVKKHKIDD